MSIVVQKYGGSSVADVDKLRSVAARVVATARSGKRVCVVVSAMGHTTDELLALAGKVSLAPPRRELDMLVSCGERISMALLSMAISELGHEAISFTGSQSWIITNDRHSGARIVEVRPVRVEEELAKGRIVIVAGFQGVSTKREITTLGRGGSDTTAVALAAALGAEYCEICSDVAGVYTADPRVVDAAQLADAISYDEMQTLAEHGARVLNPQAVEFARRAQITIHARATAQPPGLAGGTRIGGAASERRIAFVTAQEGLVRVQLGGGAAQLDARLAEEGVRLLRYDNDGAAETALFSLDDLPDWTAVRARLEALGARVTTGLAAATVVGEAIGADAGAIRRALAVAHAAGLAPLGVRATPLALSVEIAPAELVALVRALHREFTESVGDGAVGAGAGQ